jgi:hypothetical protein
MTDDFFRPGFTGGIWATGELFPKTVYKIMIGNNLSQIGINAGQITRDFAKSAAFWWMPTTGEFGPRGGYSDFEWHDKLATRFGISYTESREDRQSQPAETEPDNTQVRLSDSVIIFNTGAVTPNVTVNKTDFHLLALNAGMKYHGIHLQSEYYYRWLDHFLTDGPLPVSQIIDKGIYLQGGYEVTPKVLDVYGFWSYVTGMYNDAYELGGGVNYYPEKNQRNWRLNATAMYVEHSPASSLFGYFVGGQTGAILSAGAMLFF